MVPVAASCRVLGEARSTMTICYLLWWCWSVLPARKACGGTSPTGKGVIAIEAIALTIALLVLLAIAKS
jgi:hypothetical protein